MSRRPRRPRGWIAGLGAAALLAACTTAAPPPTGVVSIDDAPGQHPYLGIVRSRIAERWSYPCILDPATGACEYREGSVVLEFEIARSGDLGAVTVVTSSGYPTLDQRAIDAVRAAAPFPAVPADLRPDGVAIRSTFRYVLAPTR